MLARVLLGAVVVCGAVGLTRAEDKPLDRTELDKRVVGAVYESALRGTDIFNKGGHAECARLYEGTLLAVIPLLDHRPKLQDDAKKRLARAAQFARPADAAFELRTALDEIQNTIAPPKDIKKDPKDTKATLWDRLGGEKGAREFVRTAWLTAVENPKAAGLRDNKKVDSAKVEQALVGYVSANAEGPLKYSGADLKAAFGGAAITDDDFDALTAAVVEQLKSRKLPDADVAALTKNWEAVRKDVVEAPKN